MKEENDLELCSQMNVLRANHDMLNMLWRDGRLRAMADRLSYIQEAARAAEWRINEILLHNSPLPAEEVGQIYGENCETGIAVIPENKGNTAIL